MQRVRQFLYQTLQIHNHICTYNVATHSVSREAPVTLLREYFLAYSDPKLIHPTNCCTPALNLPKCTSHIPTLLPHRTTWQTMQVKVANLMAKTQRRMTSSTKAMQMSHERRRQRQTWWGSRSGGPTGRSEQRTPEERSGDGLGCQLN